MIAKPDCPRGWGIKWLTYDNGSPGVIWADTVRATRKAAIRNFLAHAWVGGSTWKQSYRDGLRCVRVRLVEE